MQKRIRNYSKWKEKNDQFIKLLFFHLFSKLDKKKIVIVM